MDDDDEFEEWDTSPVLAPRPADYVVAVLAFLAGVAEEVADLFDTLVNIGTEHVAFLNQQRRFAEEVRTSLDSIPQTEE